MMDKKFVVIVGDEGTRIVKYDFTHSDAPKIAQTRFGKSWAEDCLESMFKAISAMADLQKELDDKEKELEELAKKAEEEKKPWDNASYLLVQGEYSDIEEVANILISHFSKMQYLTLAMAKAISGRTPSHNEILVGWDGNAPFCCRQVFSPKHRCWELYITEPKEFEEEK